MRTFRETQNESKEEEEIGDGDGIEERKTRRSMSMTIS